MLPERRPIWFTCARRLLVFFILHQEGDLIISILLLLCLYAIATTTPHARTSWCRVEPPSYHHLCARGTRAKACPRKERRPRRFVVPQSNADSRLIRGPTPFVWCTKLYYLRARVFRTWYTGPAVVIILPSISSPSPLVLFRLR